MDPFFPHPSPTSGYMASTVLYRSIGKLLTKGKVNQDPETSRNREKKSREQGYLCLHNKFKASLSSINSLINNPSGKKILQLKSLEITSLGQ